MKPVEAQNPMMTAVNPRSTGKCIGTAVAIIIALGGFTTLGVGIASYADALSGITQNDAIAMMAAGGGGGIVTTILALYLNHTNQPEKLVYGPEAWKKLGLEVHENEQIEPFPSNFNWDDNDPYFNEPYRNNYLMIYMPQAMSNLKNYKVFSLTLPNLIGNLQETAFPKSKLGFRGNRTITDYTEEPVPVDCWDPDLTGWLLISKKIIPDSLNKSVKDHLAMRKENFNLPCPLDIAAICLLVYSHTGQYLFQYKNNEIVRCVSGRDDLSFNVSLRPEHRDDKENHWFWAHNVIKGERPFQGTAIVHDFSE